jgi:hypothetical protein
VRACGSAGASSSFAVERRLPSIGLFCLRARPAGLNDHPGRTRADGRQVSEDDGLAISPEGARRLCCTSPESGWQNVFWEFSRGESIGGCGERARGERRHFERHRVVDIIMPFMC